MKKGGENMGACGMALLIFLGYGIYYIAKSVIMNKEGKVQSEKFPNENSILSMGVRNSADLQKMYELGAKMIYLETLSYLSSGMTILTNKALCYNKFQTKFYVAPPSLYAEIKFDVEENTATYTTTKNKSTVGRAIVGGALAGGVGAAVGAASALSGDGTKTVSKTYNTGNYHLKINLSDIGYIEPTVLYVSKELINKLGALPLTKLDDVNSPYIKYDISKISMLQKNKIIEYTQHAINAR